jgi:hypothetical protein
MKLKQQYVKTGLMALALMAISSVASAAPLGQVLDQIAAGNFGATARFINGALYVAGFAFGGSAIYKLRKYIKDPDRESLALPAGLALCAVLCLALPSYLQTGVDTVFSSGQQLNSLGGSGMIRQ